MIPDLPKPPSAGPRRRGIALDRRVLLPALCMMLACGVCTSIAAASAALPLIPAPASIASSPGAFTLRRDAVVVLRSDNAAALGAVRYFIALAERSHALHLDLQRRARNGAGAIEFVLDPHFMVSDDPGGEGYELAVSARGVRVAARTAQGLFHGGITLRQLLDANAGEGPLRLPYVAIADHPRFGWRGLMLDSARHFQPPEEIERLLDAMAQLKLNVLHWHLTDDQGWRIEIKKYPKLTEVGAWRQTASLDGKGARYGGFYTQQQIRLIVAYARERCITIVPEIEMPGHAQAAIAAYPRLGNAPDRPPPVSADWGVHTYLFNVEDDTFAFLEDVLEEVVALFPGEYIHIGGDEAAKDQWQASARVQQRMRELGIANEAALQGWFTARIEKFLAAHGRRLIGWDEILEGGVPPRATVMSWHGAAGGIEAARSGHDVVMAPSPMLYFDHFQSSRHEEPPGRPAVVSLADVYAYEAAPADLDAAQARHILGAQASLWTEYMDTPQRLEHAAFPRAAALAEALWTPVSGRDWADFRARLPAQMARWRGAGIAAADSEFQPPDAIDPRRRNSDQLQPCKPGQGLALRLPGPQREGRGGVYNVDIFDPCWVYPAVDLDATHALTVHAGERPYNFQLWKDIKNVVGRSPPGHLLVHLDRCDGALMVDVALHSDAQHLATLELALRGQHGTHDVCLITTRGVADPLWAIDDVELKP